MESALWVLQSGFGAGGQLAARAAALMALVFVRRYIVSVCRTWCRLWRAVRAPAGERVSVYVYVVCLECSVRSALNRKFTPPDLRRRHRDSAKRVFGRGFLERLPNVFQEIRAWTSRAR